MKRINTYPQFNKILKKSSSYESNLSIIPEKKKLIDIYCELSEFGGKDFKKVRLKIYDDDVMKIIIDKNNIILNINFLKILYSMEKSFIIFTLNNKESYDYAPTFQLNFINNDYLKYFNKFISII